MSKSITNHLVQLIALGGLIVLAGSFVVDGYVTAQSTQSPLTTVLQLPAAPSVKPLLVYVLPAPTAVDQPVQIINQGDGEPGDHGGTEAFSGDND